MDELKSLAKNRVKALAAAFTLTAAGVAFIAAWEGTRLDAYPDPVGIPTICSGHTEGVMLGQRATFEQCNAWLIQDASEAGRAIARCTHVTLTQTQYDVLVSFVFNVGGSAYCRSTLAKKLNAGNCYGAAAEFDRWVNARGQRLNGLAKRRAAERKLFEADCPVEEV